MCETVACPLAFITEKNMPLLVCWSEVDKKYVGQLEDSIEPKLDLSTLTNLRLPEQR